jgi:hypothetical protein
VDFTEATDAMMAKGVTLAEMAEALGVAHTTIRASRLDPATPSYRRPPEDWGPKLAELAEDRGEALLEVARRIRGES